MHRVGLIVPHDFQLLSLAPLTAFEMTAFELAKPPPAPPRYELHLLSEHGGLVRSSCGLAVETEAFGDPAFDTIIVGAVTKFDMAPSTAGLIAFVQAAAEASRRSWLTFGKTCGARSRSRSSQASPVLAPVSSAVPSWPKPVSRRQRPLNTFAWRLPGS
jgi:hypothetical protein